MRLTLSAPYSAFAAILLTACGSSWGGDPLPTLGEVPHWPDCDEDGWGDAGGIDDDLMVCIEVGAVIDSECPFVENDLDCDDSHSGSGADLTLRGCPDQYTWLEPVTADDYFVSESNDREFLAFLQPVPRTVATQICDAWALTTAGEAPEDPGGVATLETSLARSDVEAMLASEGEITLWVGARLESGTIVWDLEGADGAALPVDPGLLPLCDDSRPFTLQDVVPITDEVTGATALLEQLASSLLLPVRFGGAAPCIVRPVSACPSFDIVGADELPDAAGCQDYGVLCERPAFQSYLYTPYRDAAELFCDAG